MLPRIFLLLLGFMSLGSVILSLPLNEFLNKLPPEFAELLFPGSQTEDPLDEDEDVEEEEDRDPVDPGINFQRPEPRLFGNNNNNNGDGNGFGNNNKNLFNLSSYLSDAPNNTAALTFVPLITILSSIIG